jgi:hypothetical protein
MNSQTCAQRLYDLIFADLNNALNIKSIIIGCHHLFVETGKVRSVLVAGWHYESPTNKRDKERMR